MTALTVLSVGAAEAPKLVIMTHGEFTTVVALALAVGAFIGVLAHALASSNDRRSE